ncbi:Uncharacterized protein APZ42_029039 [Daphnia magna]|uniref:Uncharacterized protein n=1 Tax=Daphnia magna TaxID=35525 RepID=A0A164PZ20_9CRUS|nr:Uncharacterized protein APZ42_029039 [Daphnia magna]
MRKSKKLLQHWLGQFKVWRQTMPLTDPNSTEISLGYPGDGSTDELDIQFYVPWTSSDNPNVALCDIKMRYPRDIYLDIELDVDWTLLRQLCVNVDGIPLYKSSRSQFWPILGLLRNIDGAKPFVIGIFDGTKTNGVILNGKVIPFKISAILCDAPARSFLTSVKGHTAYFGCPKCETKRKYAKNPNFKKGRVTFPTSNARLRNNHSFRIRRQAEHHKGRSMLEDLNLDMVLNISLDSMHLCDLGVMKKLMLAWAKGKFERVKLSKELFCNLDRLMCFELHAHNILSFSNYLCINPKRCMVCMVHCLTHLAQEATTYGSIDTITCYPFENFLQTKKKRYVKRVQSHSLQ